MAAALSFLVVTNICNSCISRVISKDAMDCGAEFLKFTCNWILSNCLEDLKFVTKRIDKTVLDRLQSIFSSSFERISYAEAVEILKQVNI